VFVLDNSHLKSLAGKVSADFDYLVTLDNDSFPYAFSQLGHTIAPLERSNRVNYHFLMGCIYGDVIYHHGAVSRMAILWISADRDADERIHATLRDAAFQDLDYLIAVLRGQRRMTSA
jgi:hypothetical protein